MKTPKHRDDCTPNTPCRVGKTTAIIVGCMSWRGKLRYVWVKFQEVEELTKPQKVRLV